ncbi:MAG: hypothetical protein V3U54_02990 [Thermodesulfobacteriota bacterium]
MRNGGHKLQPEVITPALYSTLSDKGIVLRSRFGMNKSNQYKLHIKIHIENASLAQTGKALGVLFRKHLKPQQINCTTERMINTEVSIKAETVVNKLLGRPSPWGELVDRNLLQTQTISLDDEKVYQLVEHWDSSEIAEYVIVVPHIFYMALLKCFFRNLELHAPEVLRNVCIVFDYANLEHIHDIVRHCFFGERAEVLKYIQEIKIPFIDSGHHLLLENLISLACYVIPAKYLVFIDDDFFINNSTSIDNLLDPLKQGYCLSGRYVKVVDRIHTSFFALRPECFYEELLLFDNGENRYADKFTSTGTITYRAFSKYDKGVFNISDYGDNDDTFGHHLGHCTTELWCDLPQYLKILFRHDLLAEDDLHKLRTDVSILLEALALVFKVDQHQHNYYHIDNELRQNAVSKFEAYFSNIYNNHHWLVHHAKSH